VDVAAAWLDAGVSLIQLRAKSSTLGPIVGLASSIVPLCRQRGVRLIVNDRADAAVLSGADGVHVGDADLSPAEVRTIVGDAAVVGFSTHTLEQVRQALDQPISYLAIGPIFRTRTKSSAWPEVGIEGVRAAVAIVQGRMPIVAIGGITLDRARDVIAAGAASVAVIGDLLTADPAARAAEYLAHLA
jgi:thiamine-phosphate pyrophosphorylase